MQERIADERRYVREMKKCPWLPPARASAVVGKPTLVPPVPSPVKNQVQTRLRVNLEYKAIKGRPDEVAREQLMAQHLQRSKSLASINHLAQRSLASSHVSSIRSKDFQSRMRYNYDDSTDLEPQIREGLFGKLTKK